MLAATPLSHHPLVANTAPGSALLFLATSACQCGVEPADSDTDSGSTTFPSMECPLDAPELQLDLTTEELDGLEGHGWRISFETDAPATAAVYFAPEGHDGPCELGLASGELTQQHTLDLTNLRLDTRYDLVIGLTDESGEVQRSQALELETSDPNQSLPGSFSRYDVYEGEIHFDAEIYGEIPNNLALVSSLNLCTTDYGAPMSGNQALLLDAEGHLIGNYVTDDLVSGFSQVHTTIHGAPGYLDGNRDIRLHIGAGVPERTYQASVTMLGEVSTSVIQPPVSESAYSMNYVHWLIDDTSALEAMGISFVGQARMSVISRSTETGVFTEALIWDDGLVTQDNEDDPEAWTLWGYHTEEMADDPDVNTYANTVFYNPVRNEVVLHTQGDQGGFIWAVNVQSSTVAWVMGADATQLEGSLPDDPIIIDSLDDHGACDDGFFARAHHVMVRNEQGDDPSTFYLTLHDNGGDETGRRLHSRAMEYRIRIDSDQHQAEASVHWAYPSNPLASDDPLYEVMNFHNFTYGSVVQLSEHPDLYLMASGNGYCETVVSDEGYPTQQIIVLLRALPEQYSAEVLATWIPGSDDFPWVNMYSAWPTYLYAEVGQPALEGGRHSFYAEPR